MAYFSLCLFSTFGFANGFHFADGFSVPKTIPGDFKTFLFKFYTAVDGGKADQAVKFFTDNNPVPIVVLNGQKATGQQAISKLFEQQVADASYDKEVYAVELIPSQYLEIKVLANVLKDAGGTKTKLQYKAYLIFVDSSYSGKLFDMEVTLA
ncbi:hypothetical protein CROQUDRAFT_54930 [Cronartium quercuum f. sp. fusiforme G11]|uniref:DUF4440 domain-containing protein n=1 Tax=Cronartium quercuum f. sp. fusiforme G11 TaxID=708437 RepID=A0A9P6T6D4_9BASI|nr:hypothetical protein CROQUDRAFT_54930 [Cronartium quercuum f. sp. fusiforme G11]